MIADDEMGVFYIQTHIVGWFNLALVILVTCLPSYIIINYK